MDRTHVKSWAALLLVGSLGWGLAAHGDDLNKPSAQTTERPASRTSPEPRPESSRSRRNAAYLRLLTVTPESAEAAVPPVSPPATPVVPQENQNPAAASQGGAVEVVPPPGPPAAAVVPLPPSYHDDVGRLTKEIQGCLEQIRIWLSPRDIAPLLAEVDRVMAEAGRLASMAADRADLPVLKVEYQKFSLVWHRLATRLRAAPAADAMLIGQVGAAQRLHDLLQEVLSVGPGRVYDREKAAACTVQLADATGQLLRVVKVRAVELPGGERIFTSAQQVKLQADGLAMAVEESQPFTTVVDQYQQFCKAWEQMTGWLRPPCPFAPEVQPLVATISRLEASLSRLLTVEPPMYSIQQRRLQLAVDITRHSDALLESLLVQLLPGSDVVHAAGDFDVLAKSLYLWLQSHPSPRVDVTVPEVTRTMEAWRRLRNQINRLERSNFPRAFEIAEQIEVELHLLHACLSE